jgi:hypothetical protein
MLENRSEEGLIVRA